MNNIPFFYSGQERHTTIWAVGRQQRDKIWNSIFRWG